MMNTTQIKFAKERAKDIYNKRRQDLINKYTTPEVRLTVEERVKALKSGEFKVLDGPKKGYYGAGYLSEYIEFNDERNKRFDKENFDKGEIKLISEYNALLEQIVLGDCKDVLKMLQNFEKNS